MRIANVIRQNLGSAGNGAAIAAGFANHGRAFTGDHRFVHGGDAFDDFAVAGDDIAGIAHDNVAGAQARRGHFLRAVAADDPSGDRVGFGLAQRIGLRLAARLRHGLGEVRKQDREPQPQSDLQCRSRCRMRSGDRVADQKNGSHRRADFHDEDHRILHQRRGIQLDEGILGRAAQDLRIEQRARMRQSLGQQLSQIGVRVHGNPRRFFDNRRHVRTASLRASGNARRSG